MAQFTSWIIKRYFWSYDYHCRHRLYYRFSSRSLPLIAIPKWVYWILLFILIDFLEYVFHLASHKINVIWKAHMMHHEDTQFNLTVGLRSSIFIPIINLPFYFIPVILGFHPIDILFIVSVQGLYQLLIHTRIIGKLGFIDHWLVTPSAHRVHHGSNKQYHDKNFGKVLLIWDHLFKTFSAENEEVVFGIPSHRMELHPIKAQFNPWIQLFRKIKRSPAQFRSILFGLPSN